MCWFRIGTSFQATPMKQDVGSSWGFFSDKHSCSFFIEVPPPQGRVSIRCTLKTTEENEIYSVKENKTLAIGLVSANKYLTNDYQNSYLLQVSITFQPKKLSAHSHGPLSTINSGYVCLINQIASLPKYKSLHKYFPCKNNSFRKCPYNSHKAFQLVTPSLWKFQFWFAPSFKKLALVTPSPWDGCGYFSDQAC